MRPPTCSDCAAWSRTIPMPDGRRACLKAGRLVWATAVADMACFERIIVPPFLSNPVE